MKAWAISVDSDNPDADNTDQALNSSKTMNATDGLFGESDKVLHFFLMSADHIRCLVDVAKYWQYRCKPAECVYYYMQIPQPNLLPAHSAFSFKNSDSCSEGMLYILYK